MYKDSKWAKEIIRKQNLEGSRGHFHSLSEPDKYSITTEQASRRLQILGYTMDDEPFASYRDYDISCNCPRRP